MPDNEGRSIHMPNEVLTLVASLRHNRPRCRDGQQFKAGYSCAPPRGLVTVGPSLGCSSNRLFAFLRSRQGALANGAEISRTQERHRSGKTNRSVSALIERPTQAWLNVTHRSSHPDESIRQAHLVWVRQMNCPDGDERKTPVTRWRYA